MCLVFWPFAALEALFVMLVQEKHECRCTKEHHVTLAVREETSAKRICTAFLGSLARYKCEFATCSDIAWRGWLVSVTWLWHCFVVSNSDSWHQSKTHYTVKFWPPYHKAKRKDQFWPCICLAPRVEILRENLLSGREIFQRRISQMNIRKGNGFAIYGCISQALSSFIWSLYLMQE